ncbi:hypothetical protein C8R44DRAFT_884901 [Mycena epipterygia]|nr:hypothetical protein C8R44DRAFT_884901 [Mycena epipterygia]
MNPGQVPHRSRTFLLLALGPEKQCQCSELILRPDVSIAVFASLLAKFKSLSHIDCTLIIDGIPSPATFPRLRSLTLHSCYAVILNSLELPNLQCLEVFEPGRSDVILPLIKRSSCVLSHLAIDLSDYAEEI